MQTLFNASTGWRYYLRFTLLIIASIAFSLCFACAAPLVAFGVFAALTLPRKSALWFTTAVWAANQLVGFVLLDYPQNANTFAHGVAMGAAAVAATALAHSFCGENKWEPASLAKMFLIAFVAYQAILFTAAGFLGGIENFTPSVVAWVLMLDLLALAGLVGYARLEQIMFSAYDGKERTAR